MSVSLETACKILAGMMGVIFAEARSSIFLVTARVSTLFKEEELNHIGSKDKYVL